MSRELFRIAAKGTREQTIQAMVNVAKAANARVMAAEPKPSRVTRSVDGVRGAREETVRVDGEIRYRYHRMDEIIRVAMETLFDLSPVLSGEYRNSHILFVKGAAASNLADWDGSGEVVITNTVPYSRKIELGKMRMTVPGTDRVYQQAAAALRSRFGNQVRIKFIYRGVVNGAMPDPMSFPSSLRKRGAKGRFVAGGHAHNKSGNRYPALEIEAI